MSKNKHEIVIKIEGETWKKALDKAFNEKRKEAKVDGFRKGKVPRDIFEKHFGKEALFIPAADYVLQEAYLKALEESKLEPVVQPDVDLKSLDEEGVEFIFKIVTKPELKIKKYKGLKVEQTKVEVTKEEIEHEIKHLLEHYAEVTVKDGKVEEGDIAVIDFEGKVDGVAFDGGKGENYSLEIGSHTFIPGFEEQVIGMSQGEEKDIKVTFPEDYAVEDLKGKEAIFTVKVEEVKTKQERKLDSDFFEDLGMENVNSKETLEKEIEASIKKQKELEAENAYVDKLLEKVGEQVEVDIPEEMINSEVEGLMKRFEDSLRMQGISLDVYYQLTASDEDALKSQLEKEAYSNVLYRLMLEEIKNLEKIEVTIEEAEKEAETLAEKYQMTKDELLKQFGGVDMIKYDLEMRKVIETLKELNK